MILEDRLANASLFFEMISVCLFGIVLIINVG